MVRRGMRVALVAVGVLAGMAPALAQNFGSATVLEPEHCLTLESATSPSKPTSALPAWKS